VVDGVYFFIFHILVMLDWFYDTQAMRAEERAAGPPRPPAAPPALSYRYNEGSRALELRFAEPLDRLRTVKIDLLEGIMSAVDNQPLAPWSVTFTTGG
jgi:hypothetical protein